MANANMKKRWPLSLLIVAAVVAVSVLLIMRFREAPGALSAQLSAQAVTDGEGGAIIAWQDKDGIRTQRIDTSGQPLWGEAGLRVPQTAPRVNERAYAGLALFMLTADGTGGAIITWQERSTFPGPIEGPPVKLYSQRISAGGELLWGGGVITGMVGPISSSMGWIVPDGTGGAIFGWNEYKTFFRGLHDDFLRLQKLTPDGRLLWGDEGVLITASKPYREYNDEDRALGIQPGIVNASRSWPTYTGDQVVVGDGAGGAIAIWYEEDYPSRRYRVHARRVNAEGNFAWPEPIELKSGGDVPHVSPVASPAGEREGIVNLAVRISQSYAAPRPSTTWMRLDMDGNVVSQTVLHDSSALVSDGLDGVITRRNEEDPAYGPPWERTLTVYLQSVDREGNALWTEKPVITTEKGQSVDAIEAAADGTGGVVVVWRLGQMQQSAHGRVLAQRLDADGNIKWDESGSPVFPDPGLQYQGRPVIVGTGSGAIVVAPVGKGTLREDMIYAQKLDLDGNRLWGNGIRMDE